MRIRRRDGRGRRPGQPPRSCTVPKLDAGPLTSGFADRGQAARWYSLITPPRMGLYKWRLIDRSRAEGGRGAGSAREQSSAWLLLIDRHSPALRSTVSLNVSGVIGVGARAMTTLRDLQAAATEHRLARLEGQLTDMLEEVRALRARRVTDLDSCPTAHGHTSRSRRWTRERSDRDSSAARPSSGSARCSRRCSRTSFSFSSSAPGGPHGGGRDGRIGAARRLEWRDYSATEQALTPRPELNKTKRPLCIPVDPENTPELMAVVERQRVRRRPECPFIFHGRRCGTARIDRHGRPRPCLGDFGKTWDQACAAISMAGRIPHDLRRSGVKHYIDAGVDPHTVMRWSGHRTTSMLQRYHIIDLDDLRRSGKRASDYHGPQENVVRGDFGRTRTVPAQDDGFSSPTTSVVAGPRLS